MSTQLDIDLDAEGRQFGTVTMPLNLAEGSGSQQVEMPIISLRSGAGPTLVLTGGVHGDEYEGPVALAELGRTLDLRHVNGHIIIMPTANGLAFLAGKRNTPQDGGNLNRAFPGTIDGTFTSRLAHFIETELLARADYTADFHGGGEILDFLPSTLFVVTGDAAEDQKRMDLAAAFGARHCMLFGFKTMGVEVGIDAAMLRQGVIGISGEYGGSAALGIETLDICRQGVRRLLAYTGIVRPEMPPPLAIEPTLVDVREEESYVVAPCEGVFEPVVELGGFVQGGSPVARMHRPDRPAEEAEIVHARCDGIVMAMRARAKSSPNDWLFVIGRPVRL
ncbi:succinylglutamate desuccinylase/aspartoacylase family protein [Mesorhizobium sp. 1M-11]|uniref:succinylglutamate desuccinylase/aspartoacylase domain-containing protein n=1 Tax=Mesorhizobium sp. 1M-11 TaxID=1529006 RepID=UPI0006C76AC5|nr:succinylglutamate desuccinylase/aspartoacylase family protein [Mesorhizobium sp. 1M-11]